MIKLLLFVNLMLFLGVGYIIYVMPLERPANYVITEQAWQEISKN